MPSDPKVTDPNLTGAFFGEAGSGASLPEAMVDRVILVIEGPPHTDIPDTVTTYEIGQLGLVVAALQAVVGSSEDRLFVLIVGSRGEVTDFLAEEVGVTPGTPLAMKIVDNARVLSG